MYQRFKIDIAKNREKFEMEMHGINESKPSESGAQKFFLQWQNAKELAEIVQEINAIEENKFHVENDLKGIFELDNDEDLQELVKLEQRENDFKLKILENKVRNHYLTIIQQLIDMTISGSSSFEEEINMVRMEILAGAGGQEAGLFASCMLIMYQNLCNNLGLNFSIETYNPMQSVADSSSKINENIPISNASIEISKAGNYQFDSEILNENPTLPLADLFNLFQCESGVHRVQRIPVTSKLNKIHTSTVAVIINPIFEEILVEINEGDLKWETFRATGAGGQHVNKTDSAVRLTHRPSGIVVSCQTERTLHINKQIALKMLKEKLEKKESDEKTQSYLKSKRTQMGNRDRNEKIKTYNIPQDRITDHRLNKNWNRVDNFMKDTRGLQENLANFLIATKVNCFREFLHRKFA